MPSSHHSKLVNTFVEPARHKKMLFAFSYLNFQINPGYMHKRYITYPLPKNKVKKLTYLHLDYNLIFFFFAHVFISNP